MNGSVKGKQFMYSEKIYYRYDLRSCKVAYQELVANEYKDIQDRMVTTKSWSYLDAYVWSILRQCHDLLRDVRFQDHSFDEKTLRNFDRFIMDTTDRLNTTKKDMKEYIFMIESRKRNHTCELRDEWTLMELIPFTESDKPVVRQRDWYMEPFSFGLHSPRRPREDYTYATFAKPKTIRAVVGAKCDNMYNLLTRLQNIDISLDTDTQVMPRSFSR